MSTSQRPPQPADLLQLRTVADAQLSPDGQRVAYVVSRIDAEADDYRTAIWVAPTNGGPPVQFTSGAQHDSAPRWSPDGAWLAFLSDRDDDKPQLYVMPTTGGEARRLTSLANGAGPAVWSPDGARLAFSARVLKDTPPSDKETRARWQQRPKVITRAHYKDDGAGYTFDAVNHLFVVPADGGEARQITQGTAGYRMPAWSPDGTRLACSRTRDGVADYNVSDIWVMDADGANARAISSTIGRAISPSWSPDGATIACLGVDEQEPGLGEALLRIWLIDAEGQNPRRLTAHYDRGAIIYAVPLITPGPFWSADGQSLTVGMADAGCHDVCRVAVTSGEVTTVVGGERQITSASLSPTANRIAFTATDPLQPGDVYVCQGDGSDERQLTHVNADLLAQWALPRVERRAFPSPHGGTLDGWVFHPVGAEGPAPLLVDIHGGPHSYHGAAFVHGYFYRYILAAHGWAVLALNPTGSGSYGKAFAHGIRGRWGEYDLPEQEAAVEALIQSGIADADRLAVAGYSYGGFMTSWIITHSERFKAAVVGAPVTNLESFFGTSDIGMWFGSWEMDGELVRDRERFRRLSPINYVERVTTPTLIVHGEADDRCPIGQGEELYVGLVAVGRVPTEFVRYPGGSHLMILTGRPSHRVDFNARVVDWLERYTRVTGL